MVVFSRGPFTGTTDKNFQKSGKQDSSRHMLKSSTNMHDNFGLHFFRTTTGIQSGPNAFDESILTNLEVTEISMQFQISSEKESK